MVSQNFCHPNYYCVDGFLCKDDCHEMRQEVHSSCSRQRYDKMYDCLIEIIFI